MNNAWLVACGVVLLAGTARADSIDDAEAKRRGVPVAQVQAENALVKEKRKVADLEKLAADLEKKIADAKAGGGSPDTPPAPNAGGGAGGPGPGAVTPLKVDKHASDPALPKLVEGPRKSSPAYDTVLEHYLTGDWTTLAAELKSKQKDLAGLPATNASDIAYIQAALQECRPAWWDKTKTGNKTTFQMNVFGREVAYVFTNSPGGWNATPGANGGKGFVNVGWPVQLIDSKNTFSFTDADVAPISAGEFTWLEGGQLTVWQAIGQKLPFLEVGLDKIAGLSHEDNLSMLLRSDLIRKETLLYYGTPKARRLEMVLIGYSATPTGSNTTAWDGEHLILPWLLAELIGHRDRYPSMDFNGLQPFPDRTDTISEWYMMDHGVSEIINRTHLTFAEDCRLRQALWEYVQADDNPTAPATTLDNGQKVTLDDHGKESRVRYNWLRNQLEAKPAESAPH